MVKKKPQQIDLFEPSIIYELGDVLKSLDKFSDIKFDLVVTSPPYNIGKEYETKKSIEDYLCEQEEIIAKIVSMISDNGSICWQVGNFIDKNSIT